MADWHARRIATGATYRQGGDGDTGYVVRNVLRLTKATKAATGKVVEFHLTVAEARQMAALLLEKADVAEQYNRDAGYRIDLPRD